VKPWSDIPVVPVRTWRSCVQAERVFGKIGAFVCEPNSRKKSLAPRRGGLFAPSPPRAQPAVQASEMSAATMGRKNRFMLHSTYL
jgi:hypothetical protein